MSRSAKQELLEIVDDVRERRGDYLGALEAFADEHFSELRRTHGHPSLGDNLVEVVHFWSPEKGFCIDCGDPAAYQAPNAYGPGKEGPLLCSVDAALHASEGEEIVYLFREDHETETKRCECCDEVKPGAPGAGGASWICNDCAAPA